MGFIIWIIGLAAAALGKVLADFLVSLNIINLPELIQALVWFLIAFIVYFFAKKIESESWFGLFSLNYFVTWAFTTVGVLIGAIVWSLIDSGSVALNMDQLTTLFFLSLPLTIGPTLAMSLGLREK